MQRSRWWQFPLRIRLTVPFLLITVIVAGLGILIVTRLMAGSVEERLANQLAASAQTAADTLVDEEQETLETLRLAANILGIAEAVQARDQDRLDALLRPVAINENLEQLIVFDRDGVNLYQFDQDATGSILDTRQTNVSLRILQQSQDALGDKFAEIVTHNNTPYLYISAPIFRDDLVGGVIIGTQLSSLIRRISNRAITQVIFYSPDGELLGTTLPATDALNLSGEQAAQLLQDVAVTGRIADLNLEPESYKLIYTPLRLRSETIGLAAYGLPSNFIVDTVNNSRNTFAAIFIIFFLCVMGIGYGLTRSVLAPLGSLLNTIRAIQAGEFDRRANLQTGDEIAELGASFDQMTDTIVKRNAQVQLLYQDQLRETARRTAILESIGDAVIVLNNDGQQVLRNSPTQKLYSRAYQTVEGKQKLDQFLAHPAELSEPQIISFGTFYYGGMARPILHDKQQTGYVIVFRDMTALIEAEANKDEIILQISHELRTPLSTMRGYIDLVGLISDSDAPGADYIAKADNQLRTLEKMVNQVIEVSTILSDRFEVYMELVDLVSAIEQALEPISQIAQAKDIQITVSTPPTLTVRGDYRRLYQAIGYLLDNAVSYTLEGGSVSLDVFTQDNDVMIRIKDTGVGISEQDLPRVFDKLYRGTAADAGLTDTRGMGVGLFLCQEIIRHHQGEVILESTLGRGTTAHVRLPILRETTQLSDVTE